MRGIIWENKWETEWAHKQVEWVRDCKTDSMRSNQMLATFYKLRSHLTGSRNYQVGDRTVGAIEKGIMVLVGIEARDTIEDCQWAAKKLTKLRLWPDDKGVARFASCLSITPANAPTSIVPFRQTLVQGCERPRLRHPSCQSVHTLRQVQGKLFVHSTGIFDPNLACFTHAGYACSFIGEKCPKLSA